MNDQNLSKRHRARIASHVPGRLRIKFHPGSRASNDLLQIGEAIGSKAGICTVRSNPAAGSLMVRYDRDRFDREGIYSVLKDADVVLADLAGRDTVKGMDLKAAVDDLRRRVGIDLGTALPLAFVVAGLWSFARNGLMIGRMPGWLFLWLALDTFVKLRRPR